MTSPSVYSIDAGMPFARELALGIAKLADSPERLARGLVLLPSRRAARALQAAFLDGAEGVPMLLPRMLPVGDFGNDDDGRLSPFLGDDAGNDLPTANLPCQIASPFSAWRSISNPATGDAPCRLAWAIA
ncbi:hypothetical protein N9L55_03595 [Alphaproteobacteria bacterium]|nr:hypothetical protein [Alphaproteobacteria bacterium]